MFNPREIERAMNGYNMDKDMLAHGVLHDGRDTTHGVGMNGVETHTGVPLMHTQFPELGNITGGLISDRIIELERRIVLYEAMFHGLSGKLDQHFKRYDMTIKAQQQQISDLNVLICELLNQQVKNAELTRDKLYHYIPHPPIQTVQSTLNSFATNTHTSFNSGSDDDEIENPQILSRPNKTNGEAIYKRNSVGSNKTTERHVNINNNARVLPTANSDTLFDDMLDEGLHSNNETKNLGTVEKSTFVREKFDAAMKIHETNNNRNNSSISNNTENTACNNTIDSNHNANNNNMNNNNNYSSSNNTSTITTSTAVNRSKDNHNNNNINSNNHKNSSHRRSVSDNVNESHSHSKYSMFQLETNKGHSNGNNASKNVSTNKANNSNVKMTNNRISKTTNGKINKARLSNIHLPSSSSPANTDKIQDFKFMKSPHSVRDIWLEYVEGTDGQPSIKQMEFMFQAGWRREPAMNKRYSRRKVLWKAIETGLQKGYKLDEIIKILEDYRCIDKNNGIKQPIGWLCQANNIPEMFR